MSHHYLKIYTIITCLAFPLVEIMISKASTYTMCGKSKASTYTMCGQITTFIYPCVKEEFQEVKFLFEKPWKLKQVIQKPMDF